MLLRGEFVFVDQAAEQVAATDAIECDHVGARSLVARRRLVRGGRCASARCGRCWL
jgi:hypothetical protein